MVFHATFCKSQNEDILMLNKCLQNIPNNRILLDEIAFKMDDLHFGFSCIDILKYTRVCTLDYTYNYENDYENFYFNDNDYDNDKDGDYDNDKDGEFDFYFDYYFYFYNLEDDNGNLDDNVDDLHNVDMDDMDDLDPEDFAEIHNCRDVINALKDAFKRWKGITNLQEFVIYDTKNSRHAFNELDLFLKENFPQLRVMITYK